jgi:hypothetical protein
MFARDFNLLNEIYNQKIVKEDAAATDVNPGTPVDSRPSLTRFQMPKDGIKRKCPNCDEESEECNCDAKDEDDMVFADKPDHSEYDSEEGHEHRETNAYMAKQQLYRVVKMASMLHDIVCDHENLEPWMAAKITQAFDDLNSIFSYKDYENFRKQIDSDMEIEEGTEKDLYDSISRGGSNILNIIKRNIRNESRQNVEKVLYEVISALESKK